MTIRAIRCAACTAICAITLTACAGGPAPRGVPSASGPIASACNASDRRAATPVRCGCIQAVANRTLSSSEQRRGARFFDDPQLAQDTRQSDRARDESLWQAWRAFGEEAERICRAT